VLNSRIRGLSLVEVAISLAVASLLLMAVVVPLTTQVQQRNVAYTERILADIQDALLGFAAVNGRLPCPATAASNGEEKFATGKDANDGTC
jgi:type II secretory pathway pseudopilin PulG